MESVTPADLVRIACLLEVSARKPGNVHPWASFDDLTYLDFALAASVIGGPIVEANGVGRAVLDAVRATRRVVSTNANLGIILLLAPLVRADDRDDLRRVLAETKVEDARLVYQAIREADPGGLGAADSQDVRDEPTVTLVEAMRLAADRDSIARQYANGFADVFEAAATLGFPLETAIVGMHLRLMSSLPDTLILRKRGRDVADESARRAGEVLAAGWPKSEASRRLFDDFDAWLRADGHARNPGATADLVAAGLYVALRDGTIALPRPAGPGGWSGTDG